MRTFKSRKQKKLLSGVVQACGAALRFDLFWTQPPGPARIRGWGGSQVLPNGSASPNAAQHAERVPARWPGPGRRPKEQTRQRL